MEEISPQRGNNSVLEKQPDAAKVSFLDQEGSTVWQNNPGKMSCIITLTVHVQLDLISCTHALQ